MEKILEEFEGSKVVAAAKIKARPRTGIKRAPVMPDSDEEDSEEEAETSGSEQSMRDGSGSREAGGADSLRDTDMGHDRRPSEEQGRGLGNSDSKRWQPGAVPSKGGLSLRRGPRAGSNSIRFIGDGDVDVDDSSIPATQRPATISEEPANGADTRSGISAEQAASRPTLDHSDHEEDSAEPRRGGGARWRGPHAGPVACGSGVRVQSSTGPDGAGHHGGGARPLQTASGRLPGSLVSSPLEETQRPHSREPGVTGALSQISDSTSGEDRRDLHQPHHESADHQASTSSVQQKHLQPVSLPPDADQMADPMDSALRDLSVVKARGLEGIESMSRRSVCERQQKQSEAAVQYSPVEAVSLPPSS